MRCSSDDPAQLSPHQRIQELASILAAGFQRFRCRSTRLGEHSLPVAPADRTDVGPIEIDADSWANGLDPGATTRPDGPQRQPEATLEA